MKLAGNCLALRRRRRGVCEGALEDAAGNQLLGELVVQ